MRTDRIEYCISGDLPSGWKIFRQGMQIGARHSFFAAVSFATQFAEREAILGTAWIRVAMEQPLANLDFSRMFPVNDQQFAPVGSVRRH
jgi:hypothetical protein